MAHQENQLGNIRKEYVVLINKILAILILNCFFLSSFGGELQFYIVSDSKLKNYKYVNENKFPKLGYVKKTPNLKICKVEKIRIQKSLQNDKDYYSIFILLSQKNSKQLFELTKKAFGKRILICINNIPLYAPYISYPINTKAFEMSLPFCKENIIKLISEFKTILENNSDLSSSDI